MKISREYKKEQRKTHLWVEMCCLEPLLSFPFLWHDLSIIIISRIYENKITEKKYIAFAEMGQLLVVEGGETKGMREHCGEN